MSRATNGRKIEEGTPIFAKKRFLIPTLVFGFALGTSLWAQANLATSPPHIQAQRASTAPQIDGRLDESAWRVATPVQLLLQREPVQGAPATERTEVRILYDDEHIYFSFRCYDAEPERIVANRMRRDADLSENDHILLVLDTYGDGRGGFFFSTNALGARRDALLTDEGRSRNEAWDCVWTCRARRDAQGWSAEIAIPFNQLRYPASSNATWGINIGRTIRRKNEEVYLVPPPQSYGFRGQYRTSRLAPLSGLGALRARTPFEIAPFVLTGGRRDFEAIDSTAHFDLDPGFDLKYGLTPSLMLDLSYKTDFAQVESDQEQVNLTRFSLFIPEKRDFFLEGAGIFDFGERVETRGSSSSRPPTLLFYSRRIGIQEGENIPVIAGSKITGRVGPYQIGMLNVWTDRKTFLDEEEEQLFRTDGGLVLTEDDPLPSGSRIVDTLEVERIDTVRVARTRFSVLRLRRDLFGQSNVGLIAIDRNPGEETPYNRSLGTDLNLSLLDATLNLRGFLARTWTPAAEGGEFAGQVELEHRTRLVESRFSYLDVQESFNPEVGFVPREDIRQFKGSIRYRPRPQTEWIRRYSIGPRFTYLVDQDRVLLTRDLQFSAFVNLEIGDWIGVRYRNRFERLDESFEIHEDIEIPEGDYDFTGYSLNLFTNDGRRLSGRTSYEFGDFFSGERRRFSAQASWKFSDNLAFETDYELNRVTLPEGNFTTNRLGERFVYSFTPDFFVRGFVQWNSSREVVGGNFLLNYRYLPGSDLFLVYNHAWNTEGDFRQAQRSLQLKLTYFWQPL